MSPVRDRDTRATEKRPVWIHGALATSACAPPILFETYGVGTAVTYRVGCDLSGQTADPNAASIVWTPDLIAGEHRETDWWYTNTVVLTASGPQVSIWFKGSQASGMKPWRVMVDDISLKEITLAAQPGDLDSDRDVDSADFDLFRPCITGPGVSYALPASRPPGCTLSRGTDGKISADLDKDNDVDQTDSGLFQRYLSGQSLPADPACVN